MSISNTIGDQTYLTVPSSLAALEERTLLPVVVFVGFTDTKRPDVDVFVGPRLERFRSFSSCFCFETSKDLSKLQRRGKCGDQKSEVNMKTWYMCKLLRT